MTSLWLTEKQQEVLWMRFIQHKTINEIAEVLGIKRRSVLARLRNAGRRLKAREINLGRPGKPSSGREKWRMVSASQLPVKGQSGWGIEDL